MMMDIKTGRPSTQTGSSAHSLSAQRLRLDSYSSLSTLTNFRTAIIMRSALFVVFAAALAGVQAQLDAIPDCALTCLLEGIIATGCAIDDFYCSCSNQEFINSSSVCVKAACSAADVDSTSPSLRHTHIHYCHLPNPSELLTS